MSEGQAGIASAGSLEQQQRLSRRDFLKLTGAFTVLSALTGASGSGVIERKTDFPETTELRPEDFEQVPLGVQADIPMGYSLAIPLAGDTFRILLKPEYVNRFTNLEAVENGLPVTKPEVPLQPGVPLLIHDIVLAEQPAIEDTKRMLRNGVYFLLHDWPDVPRCEQFLTREKVLLGDLLRRHVAPEMGRYLPDSAVRGLVLVGRPDTKMLARYRRREGQKDPNGFVFWGMVDDVAKESISFVRNPKTGIMESGKESDDKMVVRRIYVTRQPSDNLKILLSSSPFNPLEPEWLSYRANTVRVLGHEFAHVFIDGLEIPPFDTHEVVAATGLAVALDLVYGRNNWTQGKIDRETWGMPALQIMRYAPRFFRELAEELRLGKSPVQMEFTEAEVLAKVRALYNRHPNLSQAYQTPSQFIEALKEPREVSKYDLERVEVV